MNSLLNHSHGQGFAISSCILCVYLLCASFIGWTYPSYNWDMLGYLGVIYSMQTEDPAELHALAYKTARQTIPDHAYSEITTDANGSSRYRSIMARDPEKFKQQLPFYSIKPLYNAMLYAANALGANPIRFGIIISIVGAITIGISIFLLLSQFMKALWASMWSVALLSTAGIQDLIGIITPDMFCAAFVLAGFALYIVSGRTGLPLVLFTIATAIRLDSIVIVLLFLFNLKFYADQMISWPKFFSWAFGVLGLSAAIHSLSGAYGWSTVFYHSFIQSLTDPAVFTGSISIWEYVGVFIQNLRFKSPANIAIFFMILAGGGILMRKSADAYGDRLSQMFTLCFTFIVVRFFLYPAFYPRYYIPYFLLIGAFFAVRFSLLLGAYPALNRAPNPVFSFLFRPAILPIAHLRHVRQAHTSRDLPR